MPAFTALNVSPTKISTPTNIKDFVAAISSGINASGQVQSGVAIEVSPVQLIDDASPGGLGAVQDYLGGLAVSVATNSLAAGTTSDMQAAVGVRYAYGGYNPATDSKNLGSCIGAFIPPPPLITGDLDADGNPLIPPAATDTQDLQAKRQACRDAFKAANLASTAFQVAYVYSAQATGSSKLSDFDTLGNTAWMSLSYGYNSFKLNHTGAWNAPPAVRSGAFGFQPTLMVRYDGLRLSEISKTQNDLFVGARIPLIFSSWSVFVEGGYKKTNLGDLASPPATNTKQVPIGVGFDLRLADGTWFGVYAGGDANSGDLVSIGNLKWSIGENRPYSYSTAQ